MISIEMEETFAMWRIHRRIDDRVRYASQASRDLAAKLFKGMRDEAMPVRIVVDPYQHHIAALQQQAMNNWVQSQAAQM